MEAKVRGKALERLSAQLCRLWHTPEDSSTITEAVRRLDARYDLGAKITREPGVQDILLQMGGRIANAFGPLTNLRGKRILDIACGSHTSRAPGTLFINTPFGARNIRPSSQGYTAQFEPWFCRMLVELKAQPVGVDFGDLTGESFEHYRADLGQRGALDFLPDHSFNGVQDSRLFGSPEFTAQFPNQTDRLQVAQEIVRQEQRLLKADGIVIHSDARELLQSGK
jgi:hypothetical protein